MNHQHAWLFRDRVQLSLVDTSLGGYAMAVYFACGTCLAQVEYLGICHSAEGVTRLHSMRYLQHNGRWSTPARADVSIAIAPRGT